ncbi:MAG: NUDIX domain-containing protein, partial [candidate division Zixibacteria bacterium]|nr:NUDIX domain-containing protein [candidate division Zixibacteria bacterium]
MRQPIQVAIYCVRMDGAHREYLLLHRIPSGGAYWQGVTGGVEGDEGYLAAARRELEEETGFVPISIERMA